MREEPCTFPAAWNGVGNEGEEGKGGMREREGGGGGGGKEEREEPGQVMLDSRSLPPKSHQCKQQYWLYLMLSHLHESGRCCSVGTAQGCLLAKIDIESAFYNIHAHPEDRHLLGTMWNEKLNIDTVLPFGICSTSNILTLWLMPSNGLQNNMAFLT